LLNVSVSNTTKKITITPTANTGGSRTATVTVISSGATCTKTGGTITVTQTSGCTCDNFGNLTPTSFAIGPDDTSTKESSYYADSCVTVGASVPSSATWLNVVVNQNTKKILITPTANRGAERTAVITVTSTDGTCTKTGGTITVTQGNGCKCSDIVYLCNSQDFGRLSSSAEIFSSQDTTPRTVSYTADDCVTISAGTTPHVSWLTTSVDTSTKTITLTPSVNTGASRTATVTVTSSNGSSTITGGTISVTQRSGCTCNNFGNLTPTSVTFDAEDIEQK
jgi:surface adhesion protein